MPSSSPVVGDAEEPGGGRARRADGRRDADPAVGGAAHLEALDLGDGGVDGGDEVEVADAGPYRTARGAPAPEDMATFRELLAAAKQPLVVLGGGGWDAKACADIRAFVEANHLPVTTAFRNQDLIDNRHANFVGDLGLGVNPPLGKRI